MTSTRPFSPRTPPPPVALPGRMLPVAESETEVELDLDPIDEQTPPRRPFWKRVAIPLGLWLIAIGLGAVFATMVFADDDPATADDVDTAIDEAFSSTTIAPQRGPGIFSSIIPSVVVLQVANGDSGSIGTGVVVNADGSIMTSNHVVDSGGTIQVTFADGTESTAVIVQSQPDIDIAILQAGTLPEVVVPAVLGGAVPIGAEVYAVGNPLGLGGSFSAGVVSGLGRELPLEDGGSLVDLIQFDAAVNPGSSGGPLVDTNGQVVGIVTALVNPTGEDFFSGIGFAVPIQSAGGAAGGPEQ